MRSKDPSGGMNEIVLSFSNRAKRTHLHQTGYLVKIVICKLSSWTQSSQTSDEQHHISSRSDVSGYILMKFDVIQIDRLSLRWSTLSLQQYSIIEAKLTLRHTTEKHKSGALVSSYSWLIEITSTPKQRNKFWTWKHTSWNLYRLD